VTIFVRFIDMGDDDYGMFDPERDAEVLAEIEAHRGRPAIVRGTNTGAEPDGCPIGETGADPRLDLIFADGWRWSAFLNEVEIIHPRARART
jgi:hypothetical protein